MAHLKHTDETKQEDTITLYLEDYQTIVDGLETDELNDEFWHEDIQQLINEGEYGLAGYKLNRMQDKLDALKKADQISEERKKMYEENGIYKIKKSETDPGSNSKWNSWTI